MYYAHEMKLLLELIAIAVVFGTASYTMLTLAL